MRALLARAAGCAAIAATVLLLGAAPALAHASLERAEPAADSIVATAPTEVRLHFGEPVGTGLGTVKVIAPDGTRADLGRVVGQGRDVTVPLRSGLAEGTYVVAWRVTSADSHPVSGGFAFSIGHTSAAAAVPDEQTGGGTRRLMTSSRFVSFVGLMLLIGTLVVVATCWPAGAADPRVRRLAVLGWIAALAGSVGTLLLQGPSSAALGPAAAITEPSLLGDVMRTRFGQAHLSRLALLAAATPGLALGVAARARAERWLGGALAGALALLTATYSMSGHAVASSPVPLSVAVDMTHLLAVGSWLGGMVVIAVALLRSRDAAEAGARWSRLAFGSVVVLTVTGTLAGYREIGSWGALWHTRYGDLLLAKTALVAVMVGLGGLGRWLLQRRAFSTLAVSIRREAGLGVGVLAITSALVATVPASAAYVEPYSATKAAGPVSVQLDVEPARVGTDAVHIYVTDGKGKAVAVGEVTARATLPSRGFGPIDIALEAAGKGHVETLALSLPYAGDWTFALDVRVTDIDSYPVSFTVPVR